MTIINYSELQSKTINLLRFPLTVMVVFIHTPHMVINMQKISYSNITLNDFYSIVVALGHYTLTNIAVPCFFMFSGLLFFNQVGNFNTNQYFYKLKKRVSTLLIPYVFWNMLIVCIWLAGTIKNGQLAVFLLRLSEKGFLSIFWNYSSWINYATNQTYYGPALLPLWFMRDLMLSMVLSPIIYYFVKHTKVFGIITLGFLYYFKVGFVIFDYNLNQLITAIFFFSIGGYFSINEKNIIVLFRQFQLLVFFVSLISLIFSVYFYQTNIFKYVLPIYILSGVVTIVNIASFLLERGKIKEFTLLSKASFFIYLSHGVLILGFLNNFFNKVFPLNSYIVLTAKYILIPFLCSFICVVIYWILYRIAPKLVGRITGGR